ncbi:MAG: YlxM family DNA-binding protein [Clostridia bacterium]|nr:YlxM family DNA-binding protein [Clostridia bacterium]
MLEDIAEISLLYDFYGGLLTEKQSEFLRLYFEENYTLAEIAEDNGLSRQGVYDAVAKAQKKLQSFEEKLGLVARFRESEQVIAEIDSEISSLADEYKDNAELVEKLQLIRAKADRLGD